jgi:hypothetical protein
MLMTLWGMLCMLVMRLMMLMLHVFMMSFVMRMLFTTLSYIPFIHIYPPVNIIYSAIAAIGCF